MLAIRPPHVYEEIGGKPDDWDSFLIEYLDFERTIGAICEVKTGYYNPKDIFRQDYILYSLGRLGFLPDNELTDIAHGLEETALINVGDQHQICKLLISNQNKGNGEFLFNDFDSVISFLHGRIQKYPKEKYADRMFFNSTLLQGLIATLARKQNLPKVTVKRGT
jgi:hypothetical protein